MTMHWVDSFNDQEIESFIRDSFETNFSILRIETGVAITPEVKRTALNEVLLYWQKLKEVALKITDTEVRLSLPRNISPEGREFGIEGIVDIVRDDDQTIIYDIKTHNADFIRWNIDLYSDQLNIYAFIWSELYQKPLDQLALICTDFPTQVKQALSSGNPDQLDFALQNWNPLIIFKFDREKVSHTIQEFGDVVDQIEENRFEPPSVDELNKTYMEGSNERFATRICRNCDARFSCSSYRKYARHGKGQIEQSFSQYFQALEAGESLEEWRSAGLDEEIIIEELL